VEARALACVLLLCAPLGAGEGPESDPFLAALAGKSGPDAVAAPDFDPDLEAVSWSLRPRREIVDALAARLLRGEAKGWSEPAQNLPALPALPSRIPADFDPAGVPVTDRLAAWVPADAAAVFFGSLKEAEDEVGGLAQFLPRAFPVLCGDPPGGRRDALRRAREMLLLPTIWGANPNVRTGTRQVALVVSDPDVRWAPEIAFLAEVDDASLVRFHRQASLRWEERGRGVLRVDGFDAVSDDGSVRSFFALEGGVAAWSTTKALRERIVAAGMGKAPSHFRPDPRAYALARRTFPAAEGGALLVVPDGFLARVNAPEFRVLRASAMRCEAARLLRDARALAGSGGLQGRGTDLRCPGGGSIVDVAKAAGASCSVHGTASAPVLHGDCDTGGPSYADRPGLERCRADPDPLLRGAVPVAARTRTNQIEILVPAGAAGDALLDLLETTFAPGEAGDPPVRVLDRLNRILLAGAGPVRAPREYERAAGLDPSNPKGSPMVAAGGGTYGWGTYGPVYALDCPSPPVRRPEGGVLGVGVREGGSGGTSIVNFEFRDLLLEWR